VVADASRGGTDMKRRNIVTIAAICALVLALAARAAEDADFGFRATWL
jgi:hypothetical protein